MNKRSWLILALAGAAGLTGARFYQAYQRSLVSLRKAWRKFEQGKSAPVDSPERENCFYEALRLFQEVIDQNPKSLLAEEALRMQGVTYGWLGMEEEAIHVLEKAIHLFPKSAGDETGVCLAQAYQRNGELEKAYLQANRFIELSGDSLPPENWSLRNALAIKAATARELGREDEAKEAMEALERISLDSDDALANPHRL